MTLIKSFSVGNGDMFYIKHSTDNFSIIDCNIADGDPNEINEEIYQQSRNKNVIRFISTHPDEDHFHGLTSLDDKLNILNFYCVKNSATKSEETDDFKRYCELRDSDKAFYIYIGCSRRWMNQTDENRGSSGINILWPDTNNLFFKEELKKAESGGNANNLSPIITYQMSKGVSMLWMGDLESEYINNIETEINLEKTAILFAPHHGRDSGKLPESLLKKIDPEIIVVGEAPSKNLNYYYNQTILPRLGVHTQERK